MAGRKRSYERDEAAEEDREMDKMYKRNYWEDPAYAAKLRYFGLELARAAAYENLCERNDREHHAWVAARQQGSPAAGAGAADPCSMEL